MQFYFSHKNKVLEKFVHNNAKTEVLHLKVILYYFYFGEIIFSTIYLLIYIFFSGIRNAAGKIKAINLSGAGRKQ